MSRDREMPGLMSEPLPPLAWVDPSGLPAVETTAAQTPVTEWPAIEFAPEHVPKAPSTVYELPSPVLEDGDAGMDLGLDQAPRKAWPAPRGQARRRALGWDRPPGRSWQPLRCKTRRRTLSCARP